LLGGVWFERCEPRPFAVIGIMTAASNTRFPENMPKRKAPPPPSVDGAGASGRDPCNLPRHYALLTLNDASGEDTMGKLMSVALAAIPLVAVLGAMVVAP
jgi:hypothetical protein